MNDRFIALFNAQRALWSATSTTDIAVALVMLCSWELWRFCRKPNFIRTVWKHFNRFREEWKLLILSGSLLGISSRLESSLPFAQKPFLGFCDLWTVFELNTQRYSLAQARARETECVLKRCLLSGVIWAREHAKFDSRLFESLWVTLIAIGFALVFKVQLSGAKFDASIWRHL